ncbi:acyltransferase [Desulfosarcina sp. OttesenSCG-928-G10]|nr:acyltransferase [Desulfosarcina sp. OttesenSCG-928-G10]
MSKIKDFLIEIYWKLRWSSRATSFFHFLAMNLPFNAWRIFFYRMRGTKIGKNVYIVQTAFLEEARPWLITIEDNVRVSARTVLTTHDVAFCDHIPGMPNKYGPIILKKNCMVGAGAIILEGVTIGENAVVGACALVTHDVAPGMVVAGVPAKEICSVEDACKPHLKKVDQYVAYEKKTRYPWNRDVFKSKG